MNALPDRIPVASMVRSLLGIGVRYVSSGMLTMVLLLCFGALVFVHIALLGPDVRWLGWLHGLLPASVSSGAATTTMHAEDLGTLLTRAYTLLSLALFILMMLWRWLRQALRADHAVAGATASPTAGAGSASSGRIPLHVRRRFGFALGLVSAIYALAFIAIPHARMAAGSTHAGMFFVFAILYIFSVVFTALYVAAGLAADLIMDGA